MLRKKMLSFMIVLSLVMMGTIFFAMNFILGSSILRLEEKNTEKNLQRVKNIIADELGRLESIARDWANSIETYAFLAEPTQRFIEKNLSDEVFSDLKVGFMVFLDSRGRLVLKKGFDFLAGKKIPVFFSLNEHLQPGSPLVYRPFPSDAGELNLEKGGVFSGIVLLPEGPVLIAASPILPNYYEGLPIGTFCAGIFLNPANISRLAEKLYLDFTIQPLDMVDTPELKEYALSSPEEIFFIRDESGEKIEGYTFLQDIYGKPALLIKTALSRDVYRIGKKGLTFFFLSLCFIILVFWGGVFSFLEKTILSRLNRLIRSVREKKDFSVHSGSTPEPDELSLVAEEIKTILGKLENSQIKIKESEEQLKIVFERSPVGIALLDRDGRFLKSNFSLQQLLGLREKELHRSTLFERIYPGDLLPGITMVEELLAGKRNYCGIDSRFVRKDGQLVWGRMSLTLVKDSAGEFRYALGMFENISEYKKVEELLQENEIRLYRQNKILLDLAMHGAWIKESLADAVKEIVEAASLLIPAERVGVWWYDDDYAGMSCFDLYERSKNTHSSGQKLSSKEFCRYSRNHKEGNSVAAVDVFTDPHTKVFPPDYFRKTGIVSLLDAPIWLRGKVVGVFSFEHVGYPREWSNDDQRLALLMATYVSLCLEEDARKKTEKALDEEIEKARLVHERSLQEDFPQVEGYDFAAHYQPARVLGGDFYRVIHKGNQLIVYLADVSGHGLDGAMLSVFIKNTIDNYLFLRHDEGKLFMPEEILHYLTEQFYKENYPEEYFLCVFLWILNLDTNMCYFSGAGFQNPPIAVLLGGECVQLISKGMPISSALPPELTDYQVVCRKFSPGTTILFTTDGLVEQVQNGREYGDRLRRIFLENCHLTPEQIVSVINNDFMEFNGGLQGDDDITFLVLKSLPKAKSLQLELESTFQSVEEATRKVELFLGKGSGFDLLPLREVLTNAIEHGNRFDPHKQVILNVTETDRYVKMIVQDQGEGFNWQKELEKSLNPESLEERGRGIFLAKMASDFLSYNSRGNRATIVRLL